MATDMKLFADRAQAAKLNFPMVVCEKTIESAAGDGNYSTYCHSLAEAHIAALRREGFVVQAETSTLSAVYWAQPTK